MLHSHEIMHLIVHCLKELKNGIEILVGQAVFKLYIKTVKMMFRSITQEPLGLPLILMLFLSSLENLL